MKHSFIAGLLLSLCFGTEGFAETETGAVKTIRLEGTLLEKGTRTPLSDVSIFVLPAKLKTVTDSGGHFLIEAAPEGPFTWVVNRSGYNRLELNDQQLSDQPNKDRQLYLERSSYFVYETTIYGKSDKRDDSSQTLTRKEFLQVPGARGDPIKAVENLPGVARSNSFQAQVIIQGSAPQDTRYAIDGHEVPIIFHFGGLSSVLTPEAIENVDYLAAGYGPEYGRALGGQIVVTTRPPKKDRTQGFFFMDTFNTGGLLETQLSPKSSLILSARQSYVGAALRSVARNSSDFSLTVAPEFRDFTGIFQSEVTHRDTLKVAGVASQDTLQFLFTQPLKTDPAVRGNFNNSTAFFRIIPQITHRHSDITKSRYSFGFGRDWIQVDIGSNFFSLQTYALTTRAEVERKMSSLWTSYWGMDHVFNWAKVSLDLPTFSGAGGVANPVSTAATTRTSVESSFQNLGAYWRNTFHSPNSPWTLMPSARLEYFSGTKELLPLPRAAIRYAFDDSFSLKMATGLYAQAPQPQEIDSTTGNPDVKSNNAFHIFLGVDKDFRAGSANGFVLSSGPFFKYSYNQVVRSTALIQKNNLLVPENYTNKQSGKVFGGQLLLKYQLYSWAGWLSYTLSRSTRTDDSGTDYIFQYDQTHVLTFLSSIDLPHNWKISGRLRYSTGNPYTPITGGVLDADNDVYVPLRGEFYSQRLDPFMQLDLRIDKKWIFDRWMLSLYLDIQNVTNQKNIQQLQYAYNYASSTAVMGLPIIPTFGLKGEF